MILRMKHNTSGGLFLYQPLIYCVTFSTFKPSLPRSLLVSNKPSNKFLSCRGLVRTMHLHEILTAYIEGKAFFFSTKTTFNIPSDVMWDISLPVLSLEPPTRSPPHLPHAKACVAPPQPQLSTVPSSPPASLGIFLASLTPPPLP